MRVNRWSEWFEGVPGDPFCEPRKPLWQPRQMAEPPALPEGAPAAPIRRHSALLIMPFYRKSPQGSYGKHVLTPSLALTSIAAATPEGWRVRYWDENLLQGPPPVDPLPEVVGISVHLTFAGRAYQLARWFRDRGTKIVLGGMHVMSCPDEAAANADAVAIGDGVQLWPRIVRDLEAGRLRARYEAGFDQAYALEPPPRRDLVPRCSFLTTTSIIATRGCRNRCSYCYLATNGLRMPHRAREPEEVCRQFVTNNEPYGVFIDNNLGANRAYLRALCRALRAVGKIWSAAVTLDVTDDPGLVREMALAGCTGVFIGFESLSDDNLRQAHKRAPRAAEYGRRVRLFQEHGIQVNGSFVFGFDNDHRDVFQSVATWIEEHRLECATFHILTPYPGTPLFRQMEAEGRLLHRNWELYDTAHVVYRPKHMTPDELMLGYDWMYRRLFSHASIWRRRPEGLGALPAYLAGCYLYKRSNRLWHFLIKHRLVHAVWRPLVAFTRWRHLSFRRKLALRAEPTQDAVCPAPFPAGV